MREICRRLDGLPLAIELAAARLRVLSPDAILAHLRERPLNLLSGGARDAPERHRTLRESIAASYALLSGPERALLRSLSVFVAGCSLEALDTFDSRQEPDTRRPLTSHKPFGALDTGGSRQEPDTRRPLTSHKPFGALDTCVIPVKSTGQAQAAHIAQTVRGGRTAPTAQPRRHDRSSRGAQVQPTGARGAGDTLGTLEGLVDKHLARIEEHGRAGKRPRRPHADEPAVRVRLLETIREFGLEQLTALGERDDAYLAMTRWLVVLAEQAEPALYGPASSSGCSVWRTSTTTSAPRSTGV